MRVTHHSRSLLIVEYCPWTTGWFLISLALLGPWLLFRWLPVEGLMPTLLAVFAVDFPVFALFTVYVRRLQIQLDRGEGDLRVRERSLLRDREVRLPLSSLVWAERETNYKRIPFLPPHGQVHRAVLVVVEDRLLRRYPVSSVFLLGPSARRTADAVNRWLGRKLDSGTHAA